MRRLPLDLLGLGLLAAVCGVVYVQRPAKVPRAPLPAVVPEAEPEPIVAEGGRIQLEIDEGNFAGAALNGEGVALAQAGRFAEAAAKLRSAMQLSPTNELVRRNLQGVLQAWGYQELQRGQTRSAADRFAEALGFGRRPEVLTGLGVALVQTQQYGEAISNLEEALQGGAKDGATYLALGQAYEATNDRVRALEMLQRASESGVRGGALNERIERLAREVDAEWDFHEETSRHFQVRFDAGEDAHAAAEVLRGLESAYDVVGRKFGYFPDRPTPVVLYAEQDFHHITQTPDWAGAVFDGRLKFPVRGLVAGADLDRVTRHEYAHSLISALARDRAPAWLNEGLAMWAEEDSSGDRRAWAEQMLARGGMLPLSALQRPFAGLPPDRVHAAYAQSYLTVLFLIEHYDGRRLPRLLEAMRHGGSLDTAFAEVYPIDLDRFEDEAAQRLG